MIEGNRIFVVAALAAALVLAGCNKEGSAYKPKPAKKIPPAQVNPGEEATLLPLAVGNQWVYDSELMQQMSGRRASAATELTFKVTKVVKEPGGKRATIDVIARGKLSARQVWLVNKKGIFQVAVGKQNAVYNPMQPLIRFPIAPGTPIKWKGSGLMPSGVSGQGRLIGSVRGPQEFDTSSGSTMSGIFVETTTTWKRGKVQGQADSSYWWVPKVGLGRYMQTVTEGQNGAIEKLTLKSFTLKDG